MQIFILGIIDLLKKDDIKGTPDFMHGIIKGLDDAKLEVKELVDSLYELIRMLEEGYVYRKEVMDSLKTYGVRNQKTREALSELIKKLEKPSNSPRRVPIKP